MRCAAHSPMHWVWMFRRFLPLSLSDRECRLAVWCINWFGKKECLVSHCRLDILSAFKTNQWRIELRHIKATSTTKIVQVLWSQIINREKGMSQAVFNELFHKLSQNINIDAQIAHTIDWVIMENVYGIFRLVASASSFRLWCFIQKCLPPFLRWCRCEFPAHRKYDWKSVAVG